MLGLPQNELLEDLGYTDNQIEEIQSHDFKEDIVTAESEAKYMTKRGYAIDRHWLMFVTSIQFDDEHFWYCSAIDIDEDEKFHRIELEFTVPIHSKVLTAFQVNDIINLKVNENKPLIDDYIKLLGRKWRIQRKRLTAYRDNYTTIKYELTTERVI